MALVSKVRLVLKSRRGHKGTIRIVTGTSVTRWRIVHQVRRADESPVEGTNGKESAAELKVSAATPTQRTTGPSKGTSRARKIGVQAGPTADCSDCPLGKSEPPAERAAITGAVQRLERVACKAVALAPIRLPKPLSAQIPDDPDPTCIPSCANTCVSVRGPVSVGVGVEVNKEKGHSPRKEKDCRYCVPPCRKRAGSPRFRSLMRMLRMLCVQGLVRLGHRWNAVKIASVVDEHTTSSLGWPLPNIVDRSIIVDR